MMLLDTVLIIKIAVSTVVFALCLAGFIVSKSQLAQIDTEQIRLFKKQKRKKTLFFTGMLIAGWFLIGVIITQLSGIKGGMNIEFEMFSERVPVFGFSIAKTALISTGVTVILIILCVLFRVFAFPKFTEQPKGLQNALEICVETMDAFTAKAVGAKAAESLSPYMVSMALFIAGCAFSELFGLRAPTSELTTTFAMGLLTFILLNVYGFKKLGFGGRLKAMGGPVAPMRVIMVPLKMVSDIAVPLSLACRLFGNMLGGMIVMDLLKGALGGYGTAIPAIAGLYFNLFHPAIQGYIFITLSLTFIDEAMETTEEEPKEKKKKSKKNKMSEPAVQTEAN